LANGGPEREARGRYPHEFSNGWYPRDGFKISEASSEKIVSKLHRHRAVVFCIWETSVLRRDRRPASSA
jgi:hypothetical protein